MKFVLEIRSRFGLDFDSLCLVFLSSCFIKLKSPKNICFAFCFLHFKNSKKHCLLFLFLLLHFHFRFAISFGAFVKFLASSFRLDFEEELSFDFFFLFLSVLLSYIKSSWLQELAFWTTKDELKLKELFGKFHLVSRDFCILEFTCL